MLLSTDSCGFSNRPSIPSGGSGDIIRVVLNEDFEQLVKEDGQEANNYVVPLHTKEALMR